MLLSHTDLLKTSIWHSAQTSANQEKYQLDDSLSTGPDIAFSD
jgi:hypothetical protein